MNQRLTIFFSIALGLILMGIWLYIVDLSEMIAIIKKVKVAGFLPLAIMFALVYFVRSVRWKVILSPIQKISFSEAFNLCMTNYFVNFLIPIHAGEVARVMCLKKMKGTPASKSLLTIYVDKLTDTFPIILLLAATPFLSKELNGIIFWTSGMLSLIVVFITLCLVFVAYKKETAIKWIENILFFMPAKFKMKLKNVLSHFVEGMRSMTKLSGRLLEIIGLTVLELTIHGMIVWLLFSYFGIRLPVLTVMVGYLLLCVSLMLPAPPGFVGTMELSFVFIFTYLFGYDKNVVSAVAASAHIFTAVMFSLLGFMSITLIGTKLTTIFKMESEEA